MYKEHLEMLQLVFCFCFSKELERKAAELEKKEQELKKIQGQGE